ncbi:MAG: phage major capsid protein [Sphingomonadaceae bacterium]
MTYEVKADVMVTSEEDAGTITVEQMQAAVTELKSDVASLSKRLVSNGKPMLAGVRDGVERSAFGEQYLRKGVDLDFEHKKLTVSTGAEGGLAVPTEIDAVIERRLASLSPIRGIANVVKVGSSHYRKLVAVGNLASGWVSETAARTETATPTFQEIAPPMGEIYANPAASQQMLDDTMFDVESWLAGEIAAEFSRAEGVAFVNGTGVGQPKGFLTYPVAITGDAARPWGTLQCVPSGDAGAFAVTNPADKLIDLVHAVRTPYRQGAVFVMNSNTLATVRKFKDGDGGFIWRPGMIDGQPDTLLGYPVVEVDAMPDIAANSLSIAFGNFWTGYVIAERGETSVLRDPYSNKPYVHFYATRRVGGAVANSEAIKVMRFSAS